MTFRPQTCYACGARIKFDVSVLSRNGRPIPLELDGSLHDCPNKQPLQQNWGLPSKQFQKRQRQQLPLQQSLLYDQQQQQSQYPKQEYFNKEVIERIALLEKKVAAMIGFITHTQEEQEEQRKQQEQ